MIPGSISLALLVAASALGGAVPKPVADGWRVADVNGAPGLLRGDRPVAPMMFWQWRLEERDVKAMASAGITAFSCFGGKPHYLNPYWRADGSCSPDYQTKSLDELRAWQPEATFFPRLFATAPDWWIAAHPEEAIRWSNPNHGRAEETLPMRESYASEAARSAVGPRYAACVKALLARYGDRLMGIHVTNGPWGENFSWEALTCAGWPALTPDKSGYGDVSAPMTAAFRRYLREKYGTVERLRAAWRDGAVDFTNATVPDQAARYRLNADGWRDPAEGRRVPDYFECQNRVTVEMLEHYARLVKSASDGKLPTLVFYGYTQDEIWTLECDHRAVSRAYRSDVLDCFSAPHTYHRRKPGEDGAMRCYYSSAALHGKLFLDEGDDMTYLERKKPNPDCRAHAADLAESLGILYRAFGLTVSHGVGMWYMDLMGGNFRDPKLIEAVGRCRRWSEESLKYPRAHLSEVAVVSQPESEFYMGYRQTDANTVSTVLYREEMERYYRTGAPFDWYLAEDLEAVRARKYRVVALLDCEYLTDDQYATLLRMKDEGVRFVFYHAPGYVSQTGLDWARVRRLTGGAEYRTLVRHTSAELRKTFAEVGVHLYTASEDVVLSANASHVMLHARAAGDYRVRLPKPAGRIRELVTDRVLATDASACTVSLKPFETAILRLENTKEERP